MPIIFRGFFLLLAAVVPAFSQTSAGALVGLVRDAAAAAVPGATVIVTNTQTNVAFSIKTDESGNYFVPSLIPGTYSVVCEHSGFKRTTVGPVIVSVNQTTRVDLNLQVGETAESVTVEAVTSLIQTDNSTIGQVVTTRQLTELPLNGRDFRSLLRLNPGVTEPQGGISVTASIRRQGFNDGIKNVSINGARPSSVTYLIDGVSLNEPLFQFPSQVPPIEAVEEFKLQNALYPAEFGMGVGQVSIAMKSGTNQLHGSLFDFLRNDKLQKFHPRFHTKTPLKQNQFGAVAGGPVYIPKIYDGRNRTFFLASYQGGRRVIGSFGVAQVPTAAERTGDFSAWPTQLFDPLGGVLAPGQTPPIIKQPFAGNRIPADRFAPQSAALLKYWPQPNKPCVSPCNNFEASTNTPVTMNQYTVRGDHNFSTRDRIFGQYLFSKEVAPIPSVIPLSGVVTAQNSWMSAAQWTHVFSPRLINEVRAANNHFKFDQNFETAGLGTVYWKDIGLKNLNEKYQALPAMLPGTQYSSIGYAGSVPFFSETDTQHYVEHLSFITGKHTMKAGVDYRRSRTNRLGGFQGNGIITFNGAYTARNPTIAQVAGAPNTGNGFADFLLGYASLAAGTPFESDSGRLRNSDINLFVQDDIRLSSQLTINIGIRWEFRGPWSEESGGGKIFDYNFPGGRALYKDEEFVNAVNNPIFASCCSSSTVYNPDYRNFAPRIGLAWRPRSGSNRMVVRAGYGVYYDILHRFYDTQPYSINIPSILPSLPSVNGLETQPPLDLRNLFPAPLSIATRQFAAPYCQAPATESTDPATGRITVRNQCFGTGVQYANPTNTTPYTQNWGLNLQLEPRRQMLFEVGYQGSHGLHAQSFYHANQAVLPPTIGNPNNGVRFASQCPPGTYPASCSPIQDRVPYSNFVPQLSTYVNDNNAIYHAMTMKVEQRFASGLQLLAAFTWSRTIDAVSEIQTQGGTPRTYPQYAYRRDLERGVANYDQTRRFVTSVLYELPFGKGKPLLNRGGIPNTVLGGWQANTIITLADGLPFTVGCYCGDRAQVGNDRDVHRMNVIGNPMPDGFEKTLVRQFNTAAYQTPALGTLGSSGRNTLRAPGQKAADLSLFKNFRFRELFNVQFRAEAYNLMASPYYTVIFPNFNATQTNFGSLVPVGGDSGNLFNPRIYQMALRLVF
ncbi:MAG TPA: carboxypeptidase regulatory-like domain-containing protein [Bryobacteraceae bacterium]|nr:carboxypeptidase regulatory-like domain-containing protein [Bryobacteraceae bacterium]